VVAAGVTVGFADLHLGGERDDQIRAEVASLARLIAARPFDLTLVSNEVGLGVRPVTPAGLRFRDLLGHANQRLAAVCDRVVLMVAGLALVVKEQRERRTPRAATIQTP